MTRDLASDPWARSERLTLWAPRACDAEAIFDIHSDPRTYEHLPEARMRTREEADELYAAWAAHWGEHGFGYAAVRRAGEAHVIGFAGLEHQRILGRQILNVYYRFTPAAWGQGYATEAIAAAVGQAERQVDLPVVARIAVVNGASEKVVERLGFMPLDADDPSDAVPHRLWSRDVHVFDGCTWGVSM